MPIDSILSIKNPHKAELASQHTFPMVYLDHKESQYITTYQHLLKVNDNKDSTKEEVLQAVLALRILTGKVLIETLSSDGLHKLSDVDVYDVSDDNFVHVGKTNSEGFLEIFVQRGIPFTFLLNPNQEKNPDHSPLQTLTRIFGEEIPAEDSKNPKYKYCRSHLVLKLPNQSSRFKYDNPKFEIDIALIDRDKLPYDIAHTLTASEIQHDPHFPTPQQTKKGIHIEKVESLKDTSLKTLEITTTEAAKIKARVQLSSFPWDVLSHARGKNLQPIISDTLKLAVSNQDYQNDEIDMSKLSQAFEIKMMKLISQN